MKDRTNLKRDVNKKTKRERNIGKYSKKIQYSKPYQNQWSHKSAIPRESQQQLCRKFLE